jgi:hypothetical protein
VFRALVCGRLLAKVLGAAVEYGNMCVRRGRARKEGFQAVGVLIYDSGLREGSISSVKIRSVPHRLDDSRRRFSWPLISGCAAWLLTLVQSNRGRVPLIQQTR